MDNLTNYEWYPPDQIYYLPKDEIGISTLLENDGIIGNFKAYDIQTIEVNSNDVLLVHISDNLDIESCEAIFKEVSNTFPNNPVLLCNEHILKGLTILRQPRDQAVVAVDIGSEIDVDKLFDEIMRGSPNDFLH